jgi:hypothetical protein
LYLLRLFVAHRDLVGLKELELVFLVNERVRLVVSGHKSLRLVLAGQRVQLVFALEFALLVLGVFPVLADAILVVGVIGVTQDVFRSALVSPFALGVLFDLLLKLLIRFSFVFSAISG